MLSWSNLGVRLSNQIDLDLQVIDLELGTIIAGSYDQQAGYSSEQAMEYLSIPLDRPTVMGMLSVLNLHYLLLLQVCQLIDLRAQLLHRVIVKTH
ncbi:MAG: hypothetical protein Phog2KO_30330 [Phototrophicaceae bacterium]